MIATVARSAIGRERGDIAVLQIPGRAGPLLDDP
jgi:hypothetical protein